jgi:hypothetical protein
MKQQLGWIVVLLFSYSLTLAQKRPDLFSIDVQNNAVAMPFSGTLAIFHGPGHPGIRLGCGYLLKESENIQWSQLFHLGFVHQRLIHNLIPLYTENHLEYKVFRSLRAQAGLGLGYIHVVNTKDNQTYRLREDGTYEQAYKWGKGRFMGAFSLGLGYRMETSSGTWTPNLAYQFWVLAPFVKSYVPVLPNALLQVGIRFQPKAKS